MHESFVPKIILIIIVVILFAGGAGAYFILKEKVENGQVACTEEAKLCPDGSAVGRVGPNCEFAECPGEIDTSSWKTYRNEEYGFEFKYPNNLTVKIDQEVPPGFNRIRFVDSSHQNIGFFLIPERETKFSFGADLGGGGGYLYDYKVKVIYSWEERNQETWDPIIKNQYHLNEFFKLYPGLLSIVFNTNGGTPVLKTQGSAYESGWTQYLVTNEYKGFFIIFQVESNPDFDIDKSVLEKIIKTTHFKINDDNDTFKTTGTVQGKVSIGPLCPVEPCPGTPLNPYTGKKLIFTPRGERPLVDLPFEVALSSDGGFEVELPESNYSVTLSDCQYRGCFSAFPNNIFVKANETFRLDIDIDTGIR